MTTTVEERVEYIPLHNIKPSDIALRSVDRNSEKYLGLVESIRSKGVLNAILVTEMGDGIFGLADGLHRFTAARDAGLSRIPALVKSLSDTELMEAQIMTNLHKIETKPVEYTKQLYRLLAADPMLTMHDLADKLSVSTTWLRDRLSLVNLTESIQELVNEDKIKLANAFALAKLPAEEQADFVDRAMTDSPQMFVPVVGARVKEIKDANKKGKEAAPAEFVAVAQLRSRGDVEAERGKFGAGPEVLSATGAKTAQEGWQAALAWVLRLDPAGIEEQRTRFETRKKQREEARDRAKQEREKKKQEAAAAAAADISKL